MRELIVALHPIAYTCMLVMAAVLVAYAWQHRKVRGARRIGLLWLVLLVLELAYQLITYTA